MVDEVKDGQWEQEDEIVEKYDLYERKQKANLKGKAMGPERILIMGLVVLRSDKRLRYILWCADWRL